MVEVKIPFNLTGESGSIVRPSGQGLLCNGRISICCWSCQQKPMVYRARSTAEEWKWLQRAVNLYVDRNYECSDPVQDMENKLRDWGYPLSGCAGLMTAVPLEHAAVAEEDTGSAGIFVCVTAAAGNAARAGVERNVLAVYRPGTINIMLCIDGRLT